MFSTLTVPEILEYPDSGQLHTVSAKSERPHRPVIARAGHELPSLAIRPEVFPRQASI
jgi:hypothetical protein